jgi:pimeloyl-ACP methyl ester carboxylesterase
VHAVVSRGGRPDLAGPALIQVTAPTLLIVGERDVPVVELNEQARNAMTVSAELHIVPGATHLFEEPGTLQTVAEEAGTWFAAHLR